MKLNINARSDLGQRREINEDSHGISTDNKLVVVCDGMGGHNAGEVASRTAVDTILDVFQKINRDEVERICPDFKPAPQYENARRLVAAIRLANFRIYSMASENIGQSGMGTTVAAIYLDKNYLITAHVGDSRVYRFRNNKLQQLTTDHTWMGEFGGEVESEFGGIIDIGKSNVITRAVGIDPTIKIDILIEEAQPGDRYLLCSDGLSGPVPDSDIAQILVEYNANVDSISQLIALANDRGGPDNITAAIITVEKIEKDAPVVNRFQATIKEEIEQLQSEKQQVIGSLARRSETTKIKIENIRKKRSRLPLVLTALLLVSALIVIVLVLLPRKDQLFNKLFRTTQQQDTTMSGDRNSFQGESQKEFKMTQGQDTTFSPDENVQISSVPGEHAAGGTIEFFAIERDYADIIVDNKEKFKLGKLKNNQYQLLIPAGAHNIEIQLDGSVISKEVQIQNKGEVKINIEDELEKLKKSK